MQTELRFSTQEVFNKGTRYEIKKKDGIMGAFGGYNSQGKFLIQRAPGETATIAGIYYTLGVPQTIYSSVHTVGPIQENQADVKYVVLTRKFGAKNNTNSYAVTLEMFEKMKQSKLLLK